LNFFEVFSEVYFELFFKYSLKLTLKLFLKHPFSLPKIPNLERVRPTNLKFNQQPAKTQKSPTKSKIRQKNT
jgi:hypothetical protein